MKTSMTTSGNFSTPSAVPATPGSALVRCLLLSMVVTLALAMAGCSFTVHEPRDAGVSRRTTVGQELVDLKKAYDAGALSEHEYETKKAELLDGRR